MGLDLRDRVKEIASTTGTGTFTRAGAVPGYNQFTVGDVTAYLAIDTIASQWEIGRGTVTASGLTRDYVNSNSAGQSGPTAQINFTHAPTLACVPTAESLSALPGRNKLINGDMRVSQWNGNGSITPGIGQNNYVVDRWFYSGSQASKFTLQQTLNGSAAPSVFSLAATVASTATVGASDYFYVSQSIEAIHLSDTQFGTATARPLTLSYWVFTTGLSYPATLGGSLRGAAGYTRSYPFTYSVPSSGWSKITLTIPGDTAGAWDTYSNGVGVALCFGLGVGSTYSGTPGAWATQNCVSATGAQSVVASAGATWLIDDVQLELGVSPTPFERRPYGQELLLCQRYYQTYTYQTSQLFAAGQCFSTSALVVPFPFQIPMRTAPTASLPAVGAGAGQMYPTPALGGTPPAYGTLVVGRIDPTMCRIDGAGFTGSFAAGQSTLLSAGSSSATLSFSAEL